MFGEKFFRVTSGIIMLLLIIILSLQIPNLDKILKNISFLVVIPILMASFFYYMLRPSVRFLNQKIHSKTLAILITFLAMIIIIAFISYFGGSIIYNEVRRLISFLSDYEATGGAINQAFEQVEELGFLGEVDFEERITTFVRETMNRVSDYDFLGAFASLTQFAVIILLIPFLVIYFLKDDHKFSKKVIQWTSPKKRERMKKILRAIDSAFGIYIPSQLLVGCISGVIMLVGYLIIGMPNPIGLSVILAVASVIPFIGPAIGVLPAIFIALTTDLAMVIKVLILMTIVQQLEGNVIRPILQGGKLDIHPVVVIFIIIIATLLFGILGALFVVPIYASVRGVIRIIYAENKQKYADK